MGAVRKRGNIWYIDFYANGKRVRRKIGRSKKIAELALKDAEVKVARNEFGFDQADIKIDKFFEKYLEYSAANNSANTTKRYRAVIDNFTAFLEQHREVTILSKITPELIDLYKIHRKNCWINPNGAPVESEDQKTEFTRRGAKGKTINFEIDTMRALFNVAIKWGYLKDNPTRDITRLKVDDSKEVRFLTIDDCQRLLDHCPEHLWPIYFTFLHSGMRLGELVNLEWADIDFGRRKIIIRPKAFWKPKAGGREIPINQKLYDLLTKLKQTNDNGLKSSFVFPHKDGTRLKTKLSDKLIRIAKEARIKDLTGVHALRHTFASQLVMKGVDLPTVKELMGHASIDVTMIYAHLAPSHIDSAVEKLDFEL